ncbi:MAG: substrate-binding domain-containing protein [Chthoniobacter sp.]|nr:substrate-binding domain-containing protein [Chthoniobacter sp.]
MQPVRLLSAAGQVAAHLRAELEKGALSGKMHGVDRLAADLGVNSKTVAAALQQLEQEGLLVGQGQGRKRLIVQSSDVVMRPRRVAILSSDPSDRQTDYMVELQHQLEDAGHSVDYADQCMVELDMDLRRIARMVEKTEADAWLVVAGSRAVLQWFSERSQPVFALFGHWRGLPIAGTGPNKVPAIRTAVRLLIELGHQRIVMLVRPRRRLPTPGVPEQAFLDELEAHGLMRGRPDHFNLPDWEETVEGLHHILGELFRVTPPTALIVQEAAIFAGTQQFLARRRILVPEQVSLVCADPDPTFAWCSPSIAHIRWDSRPWVRRIVRWAATVSHGGQDLRQMLNPAEFVRGGTIGPAPLR